MGGDVDDKGPLRQDVDLPVRGWVPGQTYEVSD